MNRMPLNNLPEAQKNGLRYYMALMTFVVAGPVVLSAYAFALWGLTASMGLTNAFPWSVGPLSNWLIWFALALLLQIVATNLRHTSDKILQAGSPQIRTKQVTPDTRLFSRRAEVAITERPPEARISQMKSEAAAEREAA